MGRSFIGRLVLLALAFALAAPISVQAAPRSSNGQRQAQASAAGKTSPASLLNADGSLKLGSGFAGALDLSGWDVELDPARGPLFSAPRSQSAAASAAVTPGKWSALGGLGGGAVNAQVDAVLIIGSDVYVGGSFLDLDNDPAMDYIAKWDGSNWSALGASPLGDGALTGGGVVALAADGSDVIAGGWFCGGSNGGSYDFTICRIARWNGSSWSNLGSNGAGFGPITGTINAVAADGNGNIYVGGSFTNVNNNGTPIPAADYVAKWDGSNWSALGSNDGLGTNGSITNTVWALGVNGADVYVGGTFTDVNNNGTPLPTADYIAKWDGSNWSSLGNNGALTPNGSLNSWVSAIAINGSDVYVGGVFQNATNSNGVAVTAADYIAKWNGSTWSALGNNGAVTPNGSVQGWVQDIALDGSGNLYAAGYFQGVTNSDGITLSEADYVAKWNGSTWSALGSDGAGNGAITGDGGLLAVAADGSDVYVGGSFPGVSDGGTYLSHAVNLAHWNGSAWSAMGPTQGALNGTVYAVAVDGSDVYVGGAFTDVVDGNTTLPEADYIARWDGSHWHSVGAGLWGGGPLNSVVYAIVIDGSDIYVGGAFNIVSNSGGYVTAAAYLARWDTLGETWNAVGSDGGTNPSLNSVVTAIAPDGAGNLYVGGDFTNVKDATDGTLTAADYVAKWNGTKWSSLGNNGGGDGSIGNEVTALAVNGTNVYVGGYFTDVVDATNGALNEADYVAMWDGSNWSALGNCGAGAGAMNNAVLALALNGSDLYAGGFFVNACDAGGAPINEADYIARWDGSQWSALGDNGAGDGALNTWVEEIVIDGVNVYAGGGFYSVNNHGTPVPEAARVARWNGTDWAALGSDGAGGPSINSPGMWVGTVAALALKAGDLYVGGYFFNVNNNGTLLPAADRIAFFDGPGGTVTFKSTGKQDGWVLESSETSDAGGTQNASAKTLKLGDNAANKQYRAILSFKTSPLPDTAVVTAATLRIKKAGIVGTDPFSSLGDISVDITLGGFSGKNSLQLGDFQATPSEAGIATFTDSPILDWYSADLSSLASITNTGTTQFRLQFTTDDNNDGVADFLKLYSGDAASSNRPQLIITYTMP